MNAPYVPIRAPNEYLERQIEKLAVAKEIAELYPEAFREEKRWFTRSLTLEACDVVELVPAKGGGVLLLAGKRLASGGVIYCRHDVAPYLESFPTGGALEAVLTFLRWERS